MNIGPFGCFVLGAWAGITLFVIVVGIFSYSKGGKK